jgi:hypothetical protein
MTTRNDLSPVRDQAVALRAAGKSLREIREAIGPIIRVSIHESADVEAAQRFWAEVTEAPADQFRTPALKRHNPKTVRKNLGEDYHGCLRIDVRRSGELYRRIEGWVSAITASPASSAT